MATPQGGQPVSLHVDSIVLTTVNQGQGNKSGRADVTVVDNLGNPVSGANVTGTFTGDYNESDTQTTNAGGVAVFITSGTARGGINFQFCVDNVTHATLPYVPEDNVETCDSF